ncbi:MAG TPA: tetratricopeptide repeat protein, partial [Ktedonobacteraceae bacterium]|nr:tetratricopeptide repeat protein [Ktedonobacteraceae bacterium]
VVEAVDALPLALDQAGAYIEETGCSLGDYLTFYKTRRNRLLRVRGESATGHPEPVATTWSLAFEKVERAHPAAAELLRLCAFLQPDEIPEAMIMEGAPELGPVLQPVATDVFELNEAIGELRRYSLVKRDPEKKFINIHRLVQAVIKDGMKDEERKAWAERVVRMMSRVFPDLEYWQVGAWARCQIYMPHVRYCLDLIEQDKMLTPEAAQLLLRVGSYHIEQGYDQEAEQLTHQALAIYEQAFGPNHHGVAHALEQLAWVYSIQRRGKARQSESLYRRAIALYEQEFGSIHSDVAKCYNDLALLYGAQGQYDQAMQLLQQARAIREQLFDPDHNQVAQSYLNLATMFFLQGDFEQAEQLFQRFLMILKRETEVNQPVASCLCYLGLVYQEQEKYDQAKACLQESLSLIKQLWGENQPGTHYIMVQLGRFYREQGKYDQAVSLLQHAMTVQERISVSGLVYSNAYKELGILYYKQGKTLQAEPILQRALSDLQQELEIHLLAQEQWPSFFSEVVECLNTLALLYQDQGKDELAEQYHRRALALLEQGWNSNDIFKMKREKEAKVFEARAEARQVKPGEVPLETNEF